MRNRFFNFQTYPLKKEKQNNPVQPDPEKPMACITSKFFSALALRISTQEVATKSTAVTFRAFRAKTPLKRPMPAPNLDVNPEEHWNLGNARGVMYAMYSPRKTDDIICIFKYVYIYI